MTKCTINISDDDKYIISHYINEWKMMNQYVNDIDRGYMNFLTIFTAIVAATVTIMSLIFTSQNSDSVYIFYIMPLAFIATFGYMGYQFRITAILRGHLAKIEDKVNDLLGQGVYMWNSSLTEVYMAHNNVPNKSLMIPVLFFIGVTALLCLKQTIKYGIFNINVIYWPIVLALIALVLIPFFNNDKIRWKTYKSDEVIEKYKVYLETNLNK